MSIKKEWRVGTYRETIVRVSRDDLKPGRLARLFQGGVKAVLLTDDQRIAQLWEGLFSVGPADVARVGDERLPWECSILNMARNHQSGSTHWGDMIRFVPGAFAHIARKIILFPEPDHQRLQTIPDNFWHVNRRMPLSQELLRTAWDLMSDILRSALLDDHEQPPYAVTIEQLKYPNSSADLDKICNLLADSGGRWTQTGQRLDAYKTMATGPFDAKIIRDLFAWSSLIPGVSSLLHRVNKLFRNFSRKDVPRDTRIIGDPHVDGDKFLTALASNREVLITEVYDGRHWLELPLSHDTLAIFPSQKSSLLRMTPTLHRVLMKEQCHSSALSRSNVTLALAIVNRPHQSVERNSGM